MFSSLWAKVTTGTSVALLLALAALFLFKQAEISQLQSQIKTRDKTIANQTVDLATLRGNQAGLQAGLNTCNASVDAYQSVVDKIAAAGTAALAEVQKGNVALNAKLKNIDAMPAASCADAMAILKAGGK